MRDIVQRWLFSIPMAAIAMLASIAGVRADGVVGMSKPWEIYYQTAYSPVMEQVHNFHALLMVIISCILLLVLGILTYVVLRFNSKRNPVPSKTSHNTLLEFAWTVVPVMILVVIAIPSIKLLYFANKAVDPDMTLKVTAHQWYWSYNYPDNGDFSFDSIPVQADDLKLGQPRLLSVDNPVVVPVGTTVQVLLNSDDVIHNWAVPSLALKKDALPGRTNETWFRADKEGVFYGMCSELCGVNHYFMPIEVHAVSKEAFAAWIEKAKQQFAANDGRVVDVAKNETNSAR